MSSLKYFSCIVLFLFSSRIYSQIPDTISAKTFGGPLADVGTSVKQTSDGEFIVAATTSSFGAGGQDIWLIKTDENGDTLWTKTFGGAGNDKSANVLQTNDNGYAIFGTTNSYGNGGDDFLLWKTDSFGNTEWFKTYGGSFNEICTDGKQTIEGGYVVTGYFYHQINDVYNSVVIKVDKLGIQNWNKLLAWSTTDLWANSIEQTIDSIYFVGCTWGHYYFGGYAYEWYVYKLSPNGDSLYSTYYFNVGADHFKKVRNTTDGDLIYGGSTAYEHIWLRKMSRYGGTIWSRIISVAQTDLFLSDIHPTQDNGYILTAIAYANNSLNDIMLLKLDASGIVEWEKRINGSGIENAHSVYPTSDEGYIVAGQTNSTGAGNFDAWLLKFKYNASPEIQVSKDSLNLTFDDISITSRDSLTIYNTGNAALNVDTIYSTKASGFLLDIVLNDTTIHASVTWRNSYSSPFELEPNDSAKLIFTYPLWIPKSFNITETWRDTVIILNNSLNNSSLAIPMLIDFPVGISSENNSLPLTFSLSQNYPNPFNPSTVISYQLPVSGIVTLKVYDILGNEIATLVNEEKSAGTYEVEFNIYSDESWNLTSGIYFYDLKIRGPEINSGQGFIETKKMVLIK